MACDSLLTTSLLQVIHKPANDNYGARSLILTDLLQLNEIDKFVPTCRQLATKFTTRNNSVCRVFDCNLDLNDPSPHQPHTVPV